MATFPATLSSQGFSCSTGHTTKSRNEKVKTSVVPHLQSFTVLLRRASDCILTITKFSADLSLRSVVPSAKLQAVAL